MENNDILARFHELNYYEVLGTNPDRGSTFRVERGASGHRGETWGDRATQSAKRMVCRYDILRRTAFCEDESI